MAQTNYTPISLYYSTTASAAPSSSNLVNGELAINITDGKLYYKDNTGTVKVIAGAGGTGVVAGSNTQVQFNNNGVFGASANMTFDGTTLTVAGLSNTGNTTLGNASADTVTVNGTITSNLIFTDNTYDIGASGATRPRTGYFGTSIFTPLLDATNVEVTNIKALDGTASITLANSTGVASFTANPVLSGGTANGVLYLNGSKSATSGTALTFDGTNGGTTGLWSVGNLTAVSGGYVRLNRADNATYNEIKYVTSGDLFYFNQANGGTYQFNVTGTKAVDITAGTLSTYGSGTVSNYLISTAATNQTNQIVSFFNNAGSYGNLALDGSNLIFRISGTNKAYISSGGFSIGSLSNPTLVSLFSGTASTLGYSMSPSGWNGAIHRLTVPTSGDTSVWSFNWNGSAVDFSGYATSSISVAPGNLLFGVGATNTAPTTVVNMDSTGLFVPAGTLRVDGTGSRGVRLRGIGAGEVAIGGDGSTYVLSHNFYNTTAYSTELGGLYVYAAGGAFQYLAMGRSYNSQSAIYLNSSGNVGIGFSTAAQKLDINGALRFTPNTADLGYSADIFASYDSGHPFQINVKNNSSSFEMLGVYADGGGSNNRLCCPSFPFVVGTTSNVLNAKISLACASGTQSIAFAVGSGVTRASGTQYGYTLYRDNTTETNAVTFVENGGSGNNAASYVVRTNAATGGTGVTSVSGGVALVNGATSWSSYSDLRLKHDVVPVTNAIESVLKIDPIFFKWNDRPEDQQRSIGVSAQSVEKVFPELIDRSGIYDVEGGAMQVRYTELIPVLLASIQEQQAIIESLKARLDAANI